MTEEKQTSCLGNIQHKMAESFTKAVSTVSAGTSSIISRLSGRIYNVSDVDLERVRKLEKATEKADKLIADLEKQLDKLERTKAAVVAQLSDLEGKHDNTIADKYSLPPRKTVRQVRNKLMPELQRCESRITRLTEKVTKQEALKQMYADALVNFQPTVTTSNVEEALREQSPGYADLRDFEDLDVV